MDVFVTQAELARRWGKSVSSVIHATSTGRIERRSDGKFPLEKSLEALAVTERPRKQRNRMYEPAGTARPPGRPAEGEREEEAIDAVNLAIRDPRQFMRTTSLAEAARVERAAMAIARIQQVERNKREWCTVEDVAAVFDEITANIRQRILSVAGSVAALVHPQDPAKAERLISEAINDALEDLSSSEIGRQAQLRRADRQSEKAKRRSKTAEDR